MAKMTATINQWPRHGAGSRNPLISSASASSESGINRKKAASAASAKHHHRHQRPRIGSKASMAPAAAANNQLQ